MAVYTIRVNLDENTTPGIEKKLGEFLDFFDKERWTKAVSYSYVDNHIEIIYKRRPDGSGWYINNGPGATL